MDNSIKATDIMMAARTPKQRVPYRSAITPREYQTMQKKNEIAVLTSVVLTRK